MKHWAQNGFKALTSAWVLALLATVAWSQSLTWLGTLGGSNSRAFGVSANGVVFGWADTAWQRRAFRWTVDGGMQDLGALPGGYDSWANGVSADGAVVVGWADAWREHAFRWENGVMQDLGTLDDRSEAYGVSADGTVVVGTAFYYNPFSDNYDARAFRWENGVMQDLGALGGGWSEAYGVSADRSVVVGSAQNAARQARAFRWTASGGMEDLNTTYASLLTNGSVLIEARAISPDGRYIVGYGYNAATGRSREAFLLDTGPRCTTHNGDVDANGCVDDADLLAVLFAFGSTGSTLGREDANCDGTVDDADLLQVLFNFGSGC
jgi:probable HAF family extracellular repeat protein